MYSGTLSSALPIPFGIHPCINLRSQNTQVPASHLLRTQPMQQHVFNFLPTMLYNCIVCTVHRLHICYHIACASAVSCETLFAELALQSIPLKGSNSVNRVDHCSSLSWAISFRSSSRLACSAHVTGPDKSCALTVAKPASCVLLEASAHIRLCRQDARP